MKVKQYDCTWCGRGYICEETEEERIWRKINEEDRLALMALYEGKCPDCGGSLKAKFNCRECKWLTSSEEQVRRPSSFSGKQFKRTEIVFYCTHPMVSETVRDFERAFNCEFYFNPKRMTTMERWTT